MRTKTSKVTFFICLAAILLVSGVLLLGCATTSSKIDPSTVRNDNIDFWEEIGWTEMTAAEQALWEQLGWNEGC